MFWWRPKIKEAEKETETRPWNELPMDLLKEVAGKLHFPNHVRFYAVCKAWLASKYDIIPESYSLPWLVSIPYSTTKVLKCHLYEPFSRDTKPTMVLEIPLHRFLSDNQTCSSVHFDIRYIYGWLFLSMSNKRNCSFTNFALFSIYTKRFITLPPLHHPQGRKYALVNTFSSEPESPLCVFLVVQVTSTNENTVSTLRHGEKQWTTKKMHQRYEFSADFGVYMRGNFYFVSYSGQVTSYDITNGVLRDERDSDDTIVEGIDLFRMQEVFQLDGELVRIYIGRDYPSLKYLVCFIRKFDMFKKVWLPVKSLGGDRALFVSENSCFCVSTIGEEAKRNGVSVNNIYSLNMSRLAVHSLDNGKLIDITKGSEIGKWESGDDEDDKDDEDDEDDDDCEITRFWLHPLHHLVSFR